MANVTKMAQSTGATVTQEKLGEDEYKVTIQALAGEETQTAPAGAVCRLYSDRGYGSCDFF